MILYLKVQVDRITAAKYHTIGCGPTIASGSMLTELIIGKSTSECRELTVENLIEAALDGMPPDKLHCPALAIGAMKDAWQNGRIHRRHQRGRRIHRRYRRERRLENRTRSSELVSL